METTTLQAEVRDSRGKGPARRLRAAGMIPGVFYGPGVQPSSLTLSPNEVTQALRGERGRNVVFKLSVDGKDNHANVVTHCVLSGETINIADAFIQRINRLVDHRQQDAVDDKGREIFRCRAGLA